MIQRRLVLMLLGVSLTVAAPASAQRSGFIIGFGLGPGYFSPTEGSRSPRPA